jgi:zinc/manganese transport system permease protein
VAAASAELARLRQLEQDVRWGRETMADEKQERLRQYLAGRSEILAGDELALKALSEAARERQRYLVGLPLFALGAVTLGLLFSARARSGRR